MKPASNRFNPEKLLLSKWTARQPQNREKHFLVCELLRNEEGELLQVSFGTGMGSDLDFYRQIPLTSMPYGQAMAMLCLTEYLRKYF